jgi:hypothetical protein
MTGGGGMTRYGSGDGPPSSTHLGLHVGADWSTDCHTYPDNRPILAVRVGQTSVTVIARGQGLNVTAGDVDFAWALVAAANDYLIEVERLYLAACEKEAEATGDHMPEAA